MVLNPDLWAAIFTGHYVREIEVYRDWVLNRLLPTSDTIEEGAERYADEEWKRVTDAPASGDDDPTDLAGDVLDEAANYLAMLTGVRQAVLNLTVVGLHHLFEQRLLGLHRSEVLGPAERDNPSLINRRELESRLKSEGIGIHQAPDWPRVSELRDVANTIKHAEGDSAKRLRRSRPDLFTHPWDRDSPFGEDAASSRMYTPMAGEDLYLRQSDFKTSCTVLIEFWKAFAAALVKGSF